MKALTDRRGAIVNIASAVGFGNAPLLGAYSGTEAAVLRLTESLAFELRPSGVRVNAVCPAFVITSMVERLAGPFGQVTKAMGLTFEVALVTGTSRGIGYAIAKALHDEGATTVLTDINAKGVQASAASLERGHAMRCDVTNESDMQATVERIVAEFGGLDIAVANAGVARVQPISATTLADWRYTTAVNLDGVFLTLRYAGAAMAAGGKGGSLITMASVYSYASTPMMASYGASKAAALSLTKSAALEMRGSGTRANADLD